ncbi:hypothetical protein [Solimonas sp. SE-A11]|uniref:hypothetical protein n=1 Tax=Solimonas sp. SE-A11 TaxID=3054954 RepID=UPI00259C90CE|nr:hypothetical protein [Solimonas sp. SE-A11]MDM4770868.1 hypothetical protein [Solimonas sp. SE-A11]
MADKYPKTAAAFRVVHAFQDKMVIAIGVVIIFTIVSWGFIYVTCSTMGGGPNIVGHTCKDAAEAWHENRIEMLVAIVMFPVILGLRVLRDRRDAKAE